MSNLSFNVTSDDLGDAFSKAGQLVSAEVLLRANGRSKGVGIVEFKTEADAAKAIEKLNGAEIDGRAVNVRLDRGPSAPREGGARKKKSGKSTAQVEGEPACNVGERVYIGNLSWATTSEQLQDAVSAAGFKAVHAGVAASRSGRSRGYGTATFASPQDAQAAIQALNEKELDGRRMQVRLDKFSDGSVQEE